MYRITDVYTIDAARAWRENKRDANHTQAAASATRTAVILSSHKNHCLRDTLSNLRLYCNFEDT
jgi:formyltetrahydrofolate hydrolase